MKLEYLLDEIDVQGDEVMVRVNRADGSEESAVWFYDLSGMPDEATDWMNATYFCDDDGYADFRDAEVEYIFPDAGYDRGGQLVRRLVIEIKEGD